MWHQDLSLLAVKRAPPSDATRTHLTDFRWFSIFRSSCVDLVSAEYEYLQKVSRPIPQTRLFREKRCRTAQRSLEVYRVNSENDITPRKPFGRCHTQSFTVETNERQTLTNNSYLIPPRTKVSVLHNIQWITSYLCTVCSLPMICASEWSTPFSAVIYVSTLVLSL